MDGRWYVRQHRILRTALFWVVTQRVVVISYRLFGTTEMKLGESKNLMHVLKDRIIPWTCRPSYHSSSAVSRVACRPYWLQYTVSLLDFVNTFRNKKLGRLPVALCSFQVSWKSVNRFKIWSSITWTILHRSVSFRDVKWDEKTFTAYLCRQ